MITFKDTFRVYNIMNRKKTQADLGQLWFKEKQTKISFI